MKWSVRIGRLAGIDVYLHATFIILLIWLAASQYFAGRDIGGTLGALVFVLILFAIIVLHELGHALAARKYGIETRDITLLPIGGVARLESIPEDPKQELVVAIAGPAVNLVIAGGLLIGISIASGPAAVLNAGFENGYLLARLFWVNLWLAGFNLLPAFPMDGGRVLRALLAMRMNRERATSWAVDVGHAMAIIFGLVGLWTNPFLLFIAFFVWVGAEGELQHVRTQASLRGVAVSEVMATRFEVIEARSTLAEVAQRLVPGFQTEFPVLEGDKLIGFLGLDDVVKGISEGGEAAVAGAYVRTDFVTASPRELLEDVVADWQPNNGEIVAVLDNGSLVGIVTSANIGEHVLIRSALSRSEPTPLAG